MIIPEKQVAIREICHIVAGQQFDQAGHAVRVTVIRGGLSINGYLYSEKVLRQIAQLIEGAQAYADHGDDMKLTRSVRDIVGFYRNALYVPPQQGESYGRVDATLHILAVADWLWSIISESCQLGRPDLIGLSIDIFGNLQQDEGSQTRAVQHVVALNSCDVVTRPSAGGSFNRILHTTHHAHQPHQSNGQATGIVTQNLSKTAYTDTDTNTERISGIMPETYDTAIDNGTAPTEHSGVLTRSTPPSTPRPFQESPASVEHLSEQQTQLHEIQQLRQQLEQQLGEVRLQRTQLLLERRLHESILPAAVRNEIHARYAGRVFEEHELQRDIDRALQMMAQLTRDGLVRGHGYDKVSSSSQISEAEKIQAAFDLMFGLEIDSSRLGNIRGFTGIREAYTRVTGESTLAAGITHTSQLGQIHVSESAPIARISEADVTTASFSYLLGTSMNKRLLKDYQAWPAEWQKFVSVVPIRDFKQQVRVRLGAFGSLPIVAEDTPYTALSLGDSAAIYVPQKRGNLVTVSREAIINDDMQSLRQLPTKLAVAAAYTLAEFVYSFLSTNPTIYDGSVLFTSGTPHNNLGGAALSTGAMQNGITAMREQTNYANKRLGLRPRFLVVPPELEWQAMVVTKSAGLPGTNYNDINPMLGYVSPIVSPQLTSTTQWFLLGDPREIDTIEIGFVGGQVNPAFFIQDSPLLGLNFVQDSISYKIRHEYGGAVVDYRGIYRGV